jgi:hypothetical protein
MPSEGRAELMASLARVAQLLVEIGPEQAPISRDNADTRARVPVPIPQATGADGRPRGVWVRALSADQRADAEVAAHRWTLRKLGPPPPNPLLREAYLLAYDRIVDGRQVIEETALMIVDPPDMPVTVIGGWGDATIQLIHAEGLRAERLPAEVIAAELARLHGAPPPPAPLAGEDSAEPLAHGVDTDPQ